MGARICLVLVLLVFETACGSKPTPAPLTTYQVSGRVYLNQKPLARALVVFHPLHKSEGTNPRSYAQTDAEGKFSLSTFVPHDGAPTGKYRVTIHLQDEENGPVRVPNRYGDPATSGITIEIKTEPVALTPFLLRTP
jgi:hypothetical protein